MPGQTQHIHFTPERPGDYAILCTQVCGLGHYRMQAMLRVLPAGRVRSLARATGARASRGGAAMSAPSEKIGRSPARLTRATHAIFSTHHTNIGFGYLAISTVAVIFGIVLSWLMRVRLTWPDWPLPLHGAILPEEYLALVTMHGTLMLFFVLTVAPVSGFGNLILPAQIGARRMAFPRLNALGMWTTAAGLIVLLCAFFVPGGSPIAGWTSYPPLSASALAGPGEGPGQDVWLASIALFAIGGTISAVVTLTTVVKLRCDGMTWRRLPLTVWGWFTAALLADPRVLGAARRNPSSLLRSPPRQRLLHPARATSSTPRSSRTTAPARRCCGFISSGSSDTPRSTSPSFPAWASRRWSSRTSRAARSSPTA